MYEHTIGVPLVMSGPGISKGERLTTQCYLRDLFPTLCDLSGIEGPEKRIDGRSLQPAIKGEKEQVHPFVVGYFRTFQRMIRDTSWKYIEYPAVGRQQLYHLTDDPDELKDLSNDPRYASKKVSLAAALHEWMAANGDPIATEQ